MIAAMKAYIRWTDTFNHITGRIMMYGIFVMMGILLWSSISKTFFVPTLWTLEMAQFAMVAYYMLGGPYAMQMGSNVRMDLFYGDWSLRRKAWVDAFTIFFLIFYLVILLWGGISSTAYSLGHFQGEPFTFFANIVGAFFTGGPTAVGEVTGHMETGTSAWRPYIWPIKLIMCMGIFLMLLQAFSEFFKDVLRIREEPF
ncbi:TRAP transporter small permease subunit [Algicella marina]|uniref:TRAP transporter small permease protein n=1 Tax=Algicella marina TaxID=2683284 RepID=A0A6P1SXU9_9RHOB|nr:TRAP transporter small permease subunit [Algicella marina]QHQ35298.1 TRAP transporter small permease subunit [Algicella marina]